MKRFFDTVVALISLMILCIPMLIISLLIKLTSRGPVLYWSDRVGKGNAIFKMPKFRTMKADTPQVATHLLENPDQFLTKAGKFLRKSSLDELPQFPSHVPTISLQEKRALPLIFLDNMSRKTDTEIKDEVKWLCIP